MTLLYVVGEGSGWAHNELRYSLRSVCEYMPHENVVVSGTLPAWATGIAHVPGKDGHNARQRNIQGKLLTALQSGEVGSEFALFCDDMILLAPWTTNSIRHVGSFASRVRKACKQRPPGDQWRVDLERTLVLMVEMGLQDPLDFGAHHPVVLDRDKMIETLLFIRDLEHPVCSVQTYVAMHGAKVVNGFNAKVFRWNGAPTRPVLSTSAALERSPAFRQWIASRFPVPCRYERERV